MPEKLYGMSLLSSKSRVDLNRGSPPKFSSCLHHYTTQTFVVMRICATTHPLVVSTNSYNQKSRLNNCNSDITM